MACNRALIQTVVGKLRRMDWPLILTLPKQFPLITYCSRCGTFGNESHLPLFDKCSLCFRGLGCLSCGDCTVRIYGVQRKNRK